MHKQKVNNIYKIDLQYFGCINSIKILLFNSYAKIDAGEMYKKMSFRNRCIVAGSNSLITLSVPIEKGRNQKMPYRQVRIAYNENWQLQHWRTMVSCYNRSPWFEFYKNDLEALFENRFELLFELNEFVLKWLCKTLEVEMPGYLQGTDESTENLVNYKDRWLPKNYQLDQYLIYNQLFEDRIKFQPNLCILDLLFMQGPNTKNILL